MNELMNEWMKSILAAAVTPWTSKETLRGKLWEGQTSKIDGMETNDGAGNKKQNSKKFKYGLYFKVVKVVLTVS